METNGGTVKVDFGTNNLITGGGIFRYLTFNSTGQSASLIYVSSKWRIRNSGALPRRIVIIIFLTTFRKNIIVIYNV